MVGTICEESKWEEILWEEFLGGIPRGVFSLGAIPMGGALCEESQCEEIPWEVFQEEYDTWEQSQY